MNEKELEARFDKAIQEMHLNSMEISGFMVEPLLAVKVGLARGYKMGMMEAQQFIQRAKAENKC